MIRNLITVSALLIVCFSCGNKSKTDVKDILSQYEVINEKDTINYMDINGLKQGHWIVYEVGLSNVNLGITHSPDSTGKSPADNWNADASGRLKIEEGSYEDDKKVGFWKSFTRNGTVKDSTLYN